ncbi:NAD(P)-dependent oxidoreductase [Rosenbergiella australiborealis]|uniref:NAD(P)-dependent oxidoreductase n=1 Tax=Rosenbergiella australiborealis TaxID=1544696 RepID=A0ABS5T3Z1_9GAMM|nr:NAD(P)-dependent oxidoreductase [Rosenbergiella australiborealis]MBT0726468.1 NAD(P)-dependent oxidoreductase [Rosenbergiella australiborealis]
MQTKINTVAVLGLGAIGHAFAVNLAKKSFNLRAWNRSEEKGSDLVQYGATVSKTPAQAVEGSQAVILMLANAEITLDVVTQTLASLDNNAIVIQMGTIGIDATQQLNKLLQEKRPDVTFIDAPVSGTKQPAEMAQIAILASGNPDAQPVVAPVFDAIGKVTHWLGDVGAGSAMKLVVNSWLIGMVQSLAESQCLASQLGFTPETLWSVLEGGPLAAPYAKNKLAMISEGTFTPQMQLKWALKDAKLAATAGEAGQTPNLQSITEIWQSAVDAGFGEKDLSVIAQYLAQQ